MKKHKFKTIGTNAIDPASPASVWGKGVPGKGGASTNYDATMPDPLIRTKIQRNMKKGR